MTTHEHLYAFTHVGIPDYFYSTGPELVYCKLVGPGGRDLLQQLWSWAAERTSQQPTRLPDEIEVHATRLAPWVFAAVIPMVPPREAAEAHFLALTLAVQPRKTWLEQLKADAMVLTLEKTLGGRPPILCGWKDGTHLNYDRVVEPTERAFVEAVRSHIQAQHGERFSPDYHPSEPPGRTS